jgi:hypothetical protein
MSKRWNGAPVRRGAASGLKLDRPRHAAPTAILLCAFLAACGGSHQVAQDGSATQAAPAPAQAAAAPESQNPLIGNWTLVSADDAALCADSVQFTEDTYTTIWKGVTTSNSALYHAYPGYINVFSGNDLAHYQQYNLTSADIITNVTGNQYAISNCPYKRS